jgi:hypothetical protein
MTRFLVPFILAALLPATALGNPTAILTGPVTGQCVGGTAQPVTGSATGQFDGAFNWRLTVSRDDNGAVLQVRTGSQPAPIPGSSELTNIDTTSLPTGTLMRLTLDVHDSNGDANTSKAFQPQFDRTPPNPPNVTSVRAVSQRQAWTEFANVRDSGCSGGVRGYRTVAIKDNGQEVQLSGEPATDLNGVVNGSLHEALSEKVLNAGTHYRVVAQAIDRVGVESPYGIAYGITTRTDNDTILAGQVRKGTPIWGVFVGGQTMSDAGGWYAVHLPMASTNAVQYGPGCGLAAWGCPTVTSAVDTITTGNEQGIIVPRHRVMP